MRRILFIFFIHVFSLPSWAWDNHALPTLKALEGSETLKNHLVKVESLQDFLKSEEKGLSLLLRKEEESARKNLSEYKPLPRKLSFSSTCSSNNLQARFIRALRVNPDYPFAMFIQEFESRKKKSASTYLEAKAITLLPRSLPTKAGKFIGIKKGEEIEALVVFASAADEPDYGIDISLWSDSKSKASGLYGFGPQPYGGNLEYSSQAPFHMGFYHESQALTFLAGQLTDSFAEYRIHQFFSLARFAFERGHEYWGYRFAGMGVHYIQDLTQPYHSTVMPGESTMYLLSSGLLDQLGVSGPKNELAKRASDEHTLIEKFAACLLARESLPNTLPTPLSDALKEEANENRQIFSANYVRDSLTRESNEYADEAADMLRPQIEYKSALMNGCGLDQEAKASPILQKLFSNFARHTRNWISSLTAKS